MTKPIKFLIGFLVLIGCLIFMYGVGFACVVSIPSELGSREIPEILSSIVTSIGAVLATNVGAVLGIAISQPASKFRLTKTWNPSRIFIDTETFQTVACYLYIISLIACAVVWAIRGFNPDVATLITEMTKTLLGIIVGALAVSLNVPVTK